VKHTVEIYIFDKYGVIYPYYILDVKKIYNSKYSIFGGKTETKISYENICIEIHIFGCCAFFVVKIKYSTTIKLCSRFLYV
jgi:hypothetical protein